MRGNKRGVCSELVFRIQAGDSLFDKDAFIVMVVLVLAIVEQAQCDYIRNGSILQRKRKDIHNVFNVDVGRSGHSTSSSWWSFSMFGLALRDMTLAKHLEFFVERGILLVGTSGKTSNALP